MQRDGLMQRFIETMDSMIRMNVMYKKQEHRPKGLPPHAQLRVLFVVDFQGTQSVKALAEQFGMTSSAATQLVNSLVQGGLLKRTEDAHDRRKLAIGLTAKGKNVLALAKTYRQKRMVQTLAPLTDTELTQLVQIQEKIVDHWKVVCQNLSK